MASSSSSVLHLENAFAEFYFGIIPNMYDLKDRQFLHNVKSALKDIRQLKRDIDKKQQKIFFADVHYNITAVRCAYIYAYSVLHTIVVHTHLSTYLKDCHSILPKLSEKEIRICCLGGGPGTESVAICKVFNDLLADTTAYRKSPMTISLTVIDVCPNWKKEFLSIADAVNKYSILFDSKKINIKAEFIQADLLKPFSDTVRNKIKQATIITMIKLASAINEKTPEDINETLQNLFKNVIGCMKENSYLFFLDNAGGRLFSNATKILGRGPNSGEKSMLLHKQQSLDIKTLLKAEKLISSEKNTKSVVTVPTRMTTVSSCFWRKLGNGSFRKQEEKNTCISPKEVTVEDTEMLEEDEESIYLDTSGNCIPVVLISKREIDTE